jgi:hypothetical protein
MDVSLSRIPSNRAAVLIGISVALLVPVILFTFAGFQVSLTLVLAPLAGLSLLVAPASLRNLYLVCFAAGVVAMTLAAILFGTYQLRYALSLLLIMTPPLYFFLGWYLCDRCVGFHTLVTILGVIATLFVSTLAIEAIVTDTQVRWYVGELAYTVFNVDFLGLALYGSFGVLSLACLIVLEMFVIGAAFMEAAARWLQGLLAVGFGTAVFLATSCNARGAQLVVVGLIVAFGLAAVFGRRAIRPKVAILLAVTIISAAYASSRMIENLRIVDTVRELFHLPVEPTDFSTIQSKAAAKSKTTSAGPTLQRHPIDFESLSTGRESLLSDSLAEVRRSPIFGNGFGSFGRVDPNLGMRSLLSGNRTTHVQYLTILWKGGLIFFVPYMALIIEFWRRAIRAAQPDWREDAVMIGAGLVCLFTILALSWDILLVPSAGALGFFLLGTMSHSARRPG